MTTYPMQMIKNYTVTDENLDDIMGIAAYGGITYWAAQPTDEMFDAAPEGAWTIFDAEDEEVHYVTRDDLMRAIEKILTELSVETYVGRYMQSAIDNWDKEDGIDCGDIDSVVADAIVQYAIFGEAVYG